MASPSATPIGPLPNIHSSTPTPAHAPRATPSGISCAIPDDIVLEIIQFLPFKDALNLSLVSKHVYDLAPPRITTLVCNRLETVVPMHEYYVRSDDGKARALFLRSLKIGFEAIGAPDNKTYRNGKPIKRNHNDLIFQVIARAKELRYLHLEYFLGCLGYLPAGHSFNLRCRALAALTHLTHVHLCYLADDMLMSPLRNAKRQLKSVRLTRWGYDEDLISLRSALRKMGRMANAEKLVLEDIEFVDEPMRSQREKEEIEEYEAKDLVLVDVYLGVTPAQLAQMMPKLHTLRIGVRDHDYYDACFDASDAIVYPAPALRLLSVLDAHQCCPERLPWQPDALFAITTRPDKDDLGRALNVCDTRSLVGLRLRFSQVAADVWHAIVEYAPQLAWLELESIHDGGEKSVLTKLNAVISASSSTCFDHLRYLTLLFPRRDTNIDPFCTLSDMVRMDVFVRHAHARIPSLRFVGMARLDVDKLDCVLDDDYVGDRFPWKWWLIDTTEGDGFNVSSSIFEIPAWEGERVREYVRAADGQAMEEFEARFKPLVEKRIMQIDITSMIRL